MATPDFRKEEKIIFFDGICPLCNGWSKFILKVDRKKRFKLASLQSSVGQEFLKKNQLPLSSFNTLFFRDGDQFFTKSDAVLRIIFLLPFPWKTAILFKVIPRFVRNLLYDFVARHRYRIFGKLKNCTLPSEEERERFLL